MSLEEVLQNDFKPQITEQKISAAKTENSFWHSWRIPLIALATIVLILPLLVLNLNRVPAIWYDEGEFLLTSRTLAEESRYAIALADGYRGAHISVGPAVLVPVAWSMKLFGSTLSSGRICMVVWSLLAAWGIFFFAKKHFNSQTAFLALSLLLLNSFSQYINSCRNVSGEIPALAYLILGILVLSRITTKNEKQMGILSGVLFGLAISAKPHTLLIIPTFCLSLIVFRKSRTTFTKNTIIYSLVALAITATVSLIYTINGVGWETYKTQLLQLQTVFGAHVSNSQAAPIFKWNLRTIPHLLILILSILALREIKRESSSKLSPSLQFLITLSIVWQLWFILLSPGWPKYGLIGEALTSVILAAGGVLAYQKFQRPMKKIILVGLCLILSFQYYSVLKPILSARKNYPAREMAEYLDRNLPPGSIVDSYEWELAFLSRQRFRQPPLDIHYVLLRQWLGNVPREQRAKYEFWKLNSDYIILGPHGGGRFNAYPEKELKRHTTFITQIPPYYLFKMKKPGA